VSSKTSSQDELRTFARFIAVGVLNSAFGYLAFALMLRWLPRPLALLCSHLLGVAFNFHSTAIAVFDDYRYRLLARFVASYALVYAANLGMLEGLCRVGKLSDLLGQAVSLPFSALLSFTLLRVFVFVRPVS
jgi:putative flippase GtrA